MTTAVPPTNQNASAQGTIPEDWLLDTPLFIDGQQIESLYNAVALPEYEEESWTLTSDDIKVSKWSAGGELEISAGEGLLSKLVAGISGKAMVKGDKGSENSASQGDSVSLRPVRTPERRLLALALHYAASISDRVLTQRGLEVSDWLNSDFVAGSPRALMFLEILPDTPIVPMAAEQADGRVVLFFTKIAAAVTGAGQTLPAEYPRTDGENMNKFWSWFQFDKDRQFDSTEKLMQVVEGVVGDGGRPRWIDFRVPIGRPNEQVRSLHLHLKSREAYDTGDFAYRLVRQGRKHGLRIVGTLHAGPGMNVLAVYQV